MPPESAVIEMGGQQSTFSIIDPPEGPPIAVEISGLNVTGNTLVLTLNNRTSANPGNTWVFLSEVQFAGTNSIAVPEPNSALLYILGLVSVGIYARYKYFISHN